MNRQVTEFEEDRLHFDAAEGLEPRPERRCRKCRCTQNRACHHDALGACWWVAADLCSHCLPRLKPHEIAKYFAQIGPHLVGLVVRFAVPTGHIREGEVTAAEPASNRLTLLVGRHRKLRVDVADVKRIVPVPEE